VYISISVIQEEKHIFMKVRRTRVRIYELTSPLFFLNKLTVMCPTVIYTIGKNGIICRNVQSLFEIVLMMLKTNTHRIEEEFIATIMASFFDFRKNPFIFAASAQML